MQHFGAWPCLPLDLCTVTTTMEVDCAGQDPMTRLSIPDMSCGHCKAAVEAALAGVAGSGEIAVDLVAREVSVAGNAPVPALLAALHAAGYQAQVTPVTPG